LGTSSVVCDAGASAAARAHPEHRHARTDSSLIGHRCGPWGGPVRFRVVAAVPTCPLARQREAHWRLHELGDWRTAALILAAGRREEDWMALGYAGVGEWMADCGVSRSDACQLLTIARAGGAAPRESVKHAYQRSRAIVGAHS
jgi:hypothetical protein